MADPAVLPDSVFAAPSAAFAGAVRSRLASVSIHGRVLGDRITERLSGRFSSRAVSTLLEVDIDGGPKVGSTSEHGLMKELRLSRRSRVCHDGYMPSGPESKAQEVPSAAFTSACPVCHLLNPPTAEARLPECCQQSVLLQATFGNATDLVTKVDTGANHQDLPMAVGTMLGFPTLAELGYLKREDPRCLKVLGEDEEAKRHLTAAHAMFGIEYYAKKGEVHEKLVLTFFKDCIPGTAAEVKRLVTNLKSVKHVNVVALHDVCEDQATIFFLYDGGAGAGYLPMRILTNQQPLDVKELARCAQQLCSGLLSCYRNGNLLHMDLSPWNIFTKVFGEVFPVQLFGVGLAGVMHSGRQKAYCWPSVEAWIARGSFHYMPPELARIRMDADGRAPYRRVGHGGTGGQHVDEWGLGACLFCLKCGHPPFGGASEQLVAASILKDSLNIEMELADLDNGGLAILERLLHRRADHRVSIDSLISNNWLLTQVRSSEGHAQMTSVVDHLKLYAKMSTVMRTVGSVLVQNLQADKRQMIEDRFHTLDLRGDGEIDEDELVSLIAERRDEIHAIWSVLDMDNNGALCMEEFLLASVFSDDVLTERTILRTFEAMDEDCTGQITAGELYTSLRRIQPLLKPDDVIEFIGKADTDWDKDMDFDEFQGLFPNVSRKGTRIASRRNNSAKLLEICRFLFLSFFKNYDKWVKVLKKETKKVQECKMETLPQDSGGSRDTIDALRKIVERFIDMVNNPPHLELDTATMDSIRECSPFYSKSRKTQGQEKDDLKGGPPALAKLWKTHRSAWLKSLKPLSVRVKYTQHEPNRGQRRQEMLALITELLEFSDILLQACSGFIAEQSALLEAQEFEPELPAVPRCRRGLVLMIDQDELTREAIDAYQLRMEQQNLVKKEEEAALKRHKKELAERGVFESRGAAYFDKRKERRRLRATA